MNEPITVLLVDDHSLVRKGFRRMLEDDPGIQVAGEASSGEEAVEMAAMLRPQVTVMDLSLPGMDGVAATREILRQTPDCAVLVLSMHSQENYVRGALEAGARGYLLKNASNIDLAAAIRDVAGGKRVIDPAVDKPAAEDSLDVLTQREKQILQLIAEGHSNKEIAALLNLSVNTVGVHRTNLMDALGVHRTAELVLYAVRKGLVKVP